MTTLEHLKTHLRQAAFGMTPSGATLTKPLSEPQYSSGFEILIKGSTQSSYQRFIIPQLALLVEQLLESRLTLSVLEVGPGPESVLGGLPGYLRRRIRKYTAFEPNGSFVLRLETWLRSTLDGENPLPCLKESPDIKQTPFSSPPTTSTSRFVNTNHGSDRFDIVLFCHSMYGMGNKRKVIEQALDLLHEQPKGAMVVIFHRENTLRLNDLVCRETAVFPAGATQVCDNDETLDVFAAFIAGFVPEDATAAELIRSKWREICRAMGVQKVSLPGYLLFGSPEVMVAYNTSATKVTELTTRVPRGNAENRIKNRQAIFRHPATILRPTNVQQVQDCVSWALEHGLSLNVIGGSHSGNSLWSHIVSIDMDAFNAVHILPKGRKETNIVSACGPLAVVEAGCRLGHVMRTTSEAGLTVPLGARPSVGAGLWLQGGIGHLSRIHGLASDSILGAVMVSVASGRLFYVGSVPIQCRPNDAICPDEDGEILWALKGAGTNFGIVISVTFQTYTAPMYSFRSWIIPLQTPLEAQLKLSEFDGSIAKALPRNCSADAYIFSEGDKLCLGITIFEASTKDLAIDEPTISTEDLTATFGLGTNSRIVDGIGLFQAEMYISGMHGGHNGGKTSSFKRCLFLNRVGSPEVSDILISAIKSRPSPLCYIHLLQGGAMISEVPADATAFGCRDWDFACVLTGVWYRDQDETEIARASTQWVYDIAENLLPDSCGAYGADLGPDPRDAALAAKAFGTSKPRLMQLKTAHDPKKILVHACPLAESTKSPTVIFLVTGASCAGKDYCANSWACTMAVNCGKNLKARVASISEAIKKEYATVMGIDQHRLLRDRAYKEQHRQSLSTYFSQRVRQQPNFPQESFLNVVKGNLGVDVLFITGLRDTAPVATLSHLVPSVRLVEVRIKANREARRDRGGSGSDESSGVTCDEGMGDSEACADLIFNNNTTGEIALTAFSRQYLEPFLRKDLERLTRMVHSVADFPRPGVDFRHVLGVSEQPGGLHLCTALLKDMFTGDWAEVGALACCETGGFIFASALASQTGVPLALIRESGKLPPPVFSTAKLSSHISSCYLDNAEVKKIEMSQDAVRGAGSVVIVDDVLATGHTLCSVIHLLTEAGLEVSDISVMIVAEFPAHRGRELLRRRGFGGVNLQSILVLEGL